MRKYKIVKEDIKNFFFKRIKTGNIVTLRILGFTTRYVGYKQYQAFLFILNYIKPLVNVDLSDLYKDFQKKSKQKHISASIYEEDVKRMDAIFSKIEPSALPAITGELKELQNKSLSFAKELLSDIEKNTDIKIWLDGGSLIGAVRHKGFIPWDDDMDFACIRQDYSRLYDYLCSKYVSLDLSSCKCFGFSKKINKEVKKYKNQIIVMKTYDALKCIKVFEDNFIIIDFFAFDYFNDYHNVETLQRYANKINAKLLELDNYGKIQELYDEEINKNTDIVNDSDVIQMGIDNHGFHVYTFKGIIRKNDLYPLQKIKFEDTEFNAPANPHIYLKSIYNFYNRIPVEYIAIPSHANTKNKNFLAEN